MKTSRVLDFKNEKERKQFRKDVEKEKKAMKTEDYKKLTKLLDKLGAELKAHRYCIIPRYFHEGCHIGVYDEKGDLLKSVIAIDIPSAVKQLTPQPNNNEK